MMPIYTTLEATQKKCCSIDKQCEGQACMAWIPISSVIGYFPNSTERGFLRTARPITTPNKSLK